MKALYFVLASFQLSLAAPAVPAEPDAECACPMPLCPPSQPEVRNLPHAYPYLSDYILAL